MAATYSRGIYKTTTIGHAMFDGRVRNGNGSGHSFITTKKSEVRGRSLETGNTPGFAPTIRQNLKEQPALARGTEVIRPFSENYTQDTGHTTRELKFASYSVRNKESDQASRPISTSQLNTSRRLYLWPIKRVVCPWSLGSLRSGKQYLGRSLALRCFQRLSLPHMATQRCP